MIISLSGYKRAGKDTAATGLWLANFVRVGFADAIRAEAHALPNFPTPGQLERLKDTPIEAFFGDTPRDILRRLGAAKREEDPQYWVKKARAKIQSAIDDGKNVVVSDTRLPDEFAMLEEMGAVTVWIARAGVKSDGDITEVDHSKRCQHVVLNEGVVDLQRKMVAMATKLGAIPQGCGTCAKFRMAQGGPYGYCEDVGLDQLGRARVSSIGSMCWSKQAIKPARASSGYLAGRLVEKS